MPDQRFYEALTPATLAELAELTGAVLSDVRAAGRRIAGHLILGRAGPDEIAFCADRRYARRTRSDRRWGLFSGRGQREPAGFLCESANAATPGGLRQSCGSSARRAEARQRTGDPPFG